MSIATELSRIQSDKNTIRAKLVELGMATNTDNLDKLASAIENIINRGAVSVTVKEGETYTIPAGYHNGSGTVSGVAGGGNYELQSKTATPTKKQQSITPDSGYYGMSDVTVAPIPDAYQDVTSVTAAAGDVLTGKIFVASDGTVITGTMTNNGAVEKTLDVTTITYTIPKGYHTGEGKVTISLETKTVTPTKSAQEITPSTGKVLSKVTVEPIPDNFVDTTDADAVDGDILSGKFAYVNGVKVKGTMPDNGAVSKTMNSNGTYTVPAGYHNGEGTVTVAVDQGASATADAAKILDGETAMIKGVMVEGTMPNNGDQTKSMDGLTVTSVTIPAGYTTGGTVSLTSDIEEALAAI